VGNVRAVVLVGFMGAGKTSVGQLLARRLGWQFEDLDDRIQKREGRTIEQIFQDSGEPGFRRAEHEALRALLAESQGAPRIIALGGGAYIQPDNGALLRAAEASTVFLDGPADELFARCQQQAVQRPLRRDREQFEGLYAARRPQYLTASVRVDTSGKSVDAVTAEVARCLGLQFIPSEAGPPPGAAN